MKYESSEPFEILDIGQKYSKKDLAKLLDEPLHERFRQGIFRCKNSNSYLLFVNLEKKGDYGYYNYNDFFEKNIFHWDSQKNQNINTLEIQYITQGKKIPHLFARVNNKPINGKAPPYIYCGILEYISCDKNTSNPVNITYKSINYDGYTENSDLRKIYNWNPPNEKSV